MILLSPENQSKFKQNFSGWWSPNRFFVSLREPSSDEEGGTRMRDGRREKGDS